MKKPDVSRREFNKLSMAALGGMVAGTAIGCGGDDKTDEDGKNGKEPGSDTKDGDEQAALSGLECWTKSDVNVCRGLNKCADFGKNPSEHDCAGQSACFTANKHTCHYENDCKCQGGCGEHPGENACEGKGECAVPLSDEAWEKARARFVEAMDAAGKEYGEPPAKS